jgi:hypothetical protein
MLGKEGEGEGVSQFGWRERLRLCSPMMVDIGGAQAGTREEGSPVAGAREVGV